VQPDALPRSSFCHGLPKSVFCPHGRGRFRGIALNIIFSSTQAQAIRGDRANALTQRMLVEGASGVVLSLASVEARQEICEKNLHADAMVGSDPFPGFWVPDWEQLRLRDQLTADGASPTGHIADVTRLSLACDCSDVTSIARTYQQRFSWFRGVALRSAGVSYNTLRQGRNKWPKTS
jgi:hypothetical protein